MIRHTVASNGLPADGAGGGGRARWLLPILAGGLLALSFPPFPLGFAAYVALALVLFAVRHVTIRTAARRGFVFGFVANLGALYWTAWVTLPGMLTMVIVLSLYIAAVFAAYAFVRRFLHEKAVWLMPFFWIAHEYLRGLGDLAFPWTNLSLTQVHYINLIQFADLSGDLGVGFWVVLVNVVVYRLIVCLVERRTRSIGALLASLVVLFAVPLIYGHNALRRLVSTDTVRVAVLQGDIDSFHKWDASYVDQSFAVYEAQSRAAAVRGAELIVWPETAAPIYLRARKRYYNEVQKLQVEIGVPLLIGTLEFKSLPQGGYLSFNAAVGISHGMYQPRFHAKIHLVPLGEWIPFSDKIKVLDRLEVGGAHFTAGRRYVLFDHSKGPYAAAICYESAFPEIVRRFANKGARFLVNITNDGWYGMTSGPTQHAMIAVYRAIETRRPIARSANTGISVFIDRAGRLHDATHQYIPDIAIWDVKLGPRGFQTFFTRHGMFVGHLSLLVSGVALLLACVSAFLKRKFQLQAGTP